MIGKKIAHYEVSARLGAGGMGEVYLARDVTLGRDVALKFLPKEMSADPTARARLLNEARTASALNHPNICTIYEVGEAEGQTYVGMELVSGKPLSQLIPPEGLPLESVTRYGAQVADAAAHAHELGIIHRDLKTSNVMITREGRAKVLDFGLAKQLREEQMAEATKSKVSLTQAGAIVGTLHAIAPEVLSGQPSDARSDIWALGVLLYEMASGALPFQGKTGFEMTSAILREPPAPLPERVPAGLRAIIQRCLAKEPGQRYQRASEVRAALEAIGSDTRVTVTMPPATASRPWWRGRAMLAFLVVGTLLALAIWKGPLLISIGKTELPAAAPAAGPRLSNGEHASSQPEANEYFEKAELFLTTNFDLHKARQMLEKALEIDPKFAAARAEYGFTSYLMIDTGLSNDSQWLYSAEEQLRLALADDPNCGRAYSALAAVYLMQGRKELVPGAVQKAQQLNPTGNELDTLNWLQNYHALNGDNATAQAICRKILERAPLFFPARMNLADLLREAGDTAQATREIEKVREQVPSIIFAHNVLWRIYAENGDLARARKTLEGIPAAERRNFQARYAWAIQYALEGKRREALKEMDVELQKYLALNPSTTALAASFYAVLEDSDKALDWLERAMRNGDERGEWFRRDPLLKNVREHPRFKQIIESIAYRREQRKSR